MKYYSKYMETNEGDVDGSVISRKIRTEFKRNNPLNLKREDIVKE